MRGCNQQITIWNKWRSPETKRDEFIRHVIPVLCKFKNKVRSGVTGNSANIAQSCMVIIPHTPLYRPVREWDAMDEEGRGMYFTARIGDTVALGAHEVEITGVRPFAESDVRTMLLPDTFTIRVVQDNTRDALGRHIKLEGV